jgi:hypothetical protein
VLSSAESINMALLTEGRVLVCRAHALAGYAASCGSFSLRRCSQRSNEDGHSDECLPSNSENTAVS